MSHERRYRAPILSNVNGNRAARAGCVADAERQQRNDAACEGKLTSCRILQGVRDLMAHKGMSVTTVTMREVERRCLPSECEDGKRGSGRLEWEEAITQPVQSFSPFIVASRLNSPTHSVSLRHLPRSPSLPLYISPFPHPPTFSFPLLLSHGLHYPISLGFHPFPLCFIPNPRQ